MWTGHTVNELIPIVFISKRVDYFEWILGIAFGMALSEWHTFMSNHDEKTNLVEMNWKTCI